MADETEKTAGAAVEQTPERKGPSFVFEQEITGKDGKMFVQKFGAAFQREDGSHNMVFDAQPLRGQPVMRTPEQRLEAMKERQQTPNSRGHER